MDQQNYLPVDPGDAPTEDPKATAAKIYLAKTLNDLQQEFPWATITGSLGGKTGYALVFNCGRPKCPAEIRGYAEMVRHLTKGVHKDDAARGAEAAAAKAEVIAKDVAPETAAGEVELTADEAELTAEEAELIARFAEATLRRAELAASGVHLTDEETEPATEKVERTPREAELEQVLDDLRACFHGALLSGGFGGEDGCTFIFKCHWRRCTGIGALEKDDMIRHLQRKVLHYGMSEEWTASRDRAMYEIDGMSLRNRLRVRQILVDRLAMIDKKTADIQKNGS